MESLVNVIQFTDVLSQMDKENNKILSYKMIWWAYIGEMTFFMSVSFQFTFVPDCLGELGDIFSNEQTCTV